VSGLGPHCVGQRVVVRRLVPGESGPTGGPAMTDLLGTMLAWSATDTVVEAESGERVRIALADIVSGKPVPPRPSVRLRVSAADAERRALTGWPAAESVPLGEWVLRASAGFSARADSVLAVGDPGAPIDDALAAVEEFYAARGLPAWAQVVVGSEEEAALVGHGWLDARPGEADTHFQIAAVAQLARGLRASRRPAASARPGRPTDPATSRTESPSTRRVLTVSATASDAWLADDERARTSPEAARTVLEGPDEVGFVSVRLVATGDGDPAGDARDVGGDDEPAGPVVAKGRVSCAEDWAGITDVWVSPEHRRQGLALTVLEGLLDWAAERGARTAYLQVRGDNATALALYDRLGFVTHHTYRYLRAPG
jgi:ribosomal protein S18 acetylase RimI-like enzyme